VLDLVSAKGQQHQQRLVRRPLPVPLMLAERCEPLQQALGYLL
jgi:hypothetical protein